MADATRRVVSERYGLECRVAGNIGGIAKSISRYVIDRLLIS